MPSEMTPTPPGKDSCEYCGLPKDNGWEHGKQRGYGDFATMSCSFPTVEPLDAEQEVRRVYSDAHWVFLSHRDMKYEIWATGHSAIGKGHTSHSAWLDAQSKLPKPSSVPPAEEDLSRFSVCEKCGHEVGRGVHKCEVSSPPAEFEKVDRFVLTHEDRSPQLASYVSSSDYQKLLNFTRGVVDENETLKYAEHKWLNGMIRDTDRICDLERALTTLQSKYEALWGEKEKVEPK